MFRSCKPTKFTVKILYIGATFVFFLFNQLTQSGRFVHQMESIVTLNVERCESSSVGLRVNIKVLTIHSSKNIATTRFSFRIRLGNLPKGIVKP